MQWETGTGSIPATSTRDCKATNLDHIAHANDEKHDPKLEALHDVGTGELEGILLLKPLEDATLDLDELVRDEQCEQSVGVRVDSDIEGRDLIEKSHGVKSVVDQGQ
jgi:hypothetical protein